VQAALMSQLLLREFITELSFEKLLDTYLTWTI
jgi:hypothetical protein